MNHTQHSDPHYGSLLSFFCIIGPPTSQLLTKHDSKNPVMWVSGYCCERPTGLQ